ncbi:MAG: response regulator transcription factor [Verrucomicrobiota bacterium]
MSARILVIEDDESLRRGLCDNLAAQGWEVKDAADGDRGLELAFDWTADLIVLDIMLPGVNGYEICQALRREKIDTPILMLTAKGQTDDVVTGLQLGADDYMVKPFALRELLARVQVLLRRTDHSASRYELENGAVLDVDARRFSIGDQAIDLTPKEFDLLTVLLQNAGRALSREQLIGKVWGHGLIVTHRSVDRCVKTLRAKLGQTQAVQLSSIRGIGYRWDGTVTPSE